MSEHTAIVKALADLERAVKAFLDEMEEADETGERLGWPNELEQLTGWTPKGDEI